MALLPRPQSFVTIVMPYYPEGDLRGYVQSFQLKGQCSVADVTRAMKVFSFFVVAAFVRHARRERSRRLRRRPDVVPATESLG